MMLAPPQVVGVLLKKPGQQSDPRVPPIDPQETKIRGELYVEDLNERRIVSIKMGWLWVESTQMKLPLRALNLRQATPGICQPHVLALGFTLSNSQGDLLATFWADTEPIYWSWVRAIAAELVRQTPFRAQRCLNFLEILTICPRGPLPLPDSPTETRRRSRSELRCWLSNSPMNKKSARSSSILEDSRRRARSELRGWSSSNSSDEDLHLAEFRGIDSAILPKIETSMSGRAWGCSESSEGSDDSLPWGAGCRSSVDSIDSAATIPEADTRELRIQRYKEARRRENEARSRRVLEEDALRRKARLEENNNNNNNSHNNNNINNNYEGTAKACNIACRESSRARGEDVEVEGQFNLEDKSLESRKTQKTPGKTGNGTCRESSRARNENVEVEGQFNLEDKSEGLESRKTPKTPGKTGNGTCRESSRARGENVEVERQFNLEDKSESLESRKTPKSPGKTCNVAYRESSRTTRNENVEVEKQFDLQDCSEQNLEARKTPKSPTKACNVAYRESSRTTRNENVEVEKQFDLQDCSEQNLEARKTPKSPTKACNNACRESITTRNENVEFEKQFNPEDKSESFESHKTPKTPVKTCNLACRESRTTRTENVEFEKQFNPEESFESRKTPKTPGKTCNVACRESTTTRNENVEFEKQFNPEDKSESSESRKTPKPPSEPESQVSLSEISRRSVRSREKNSSSNTRSVESTRTTRISRTVEVLEPIVRGSSRRETLDCERKKNSEASRRAETPDDFVRPPDTLDSMRKLPPLKVSSTNSTIVRFRESDDGPENPPRCTESAGVVRTDSGERRSRARERRNVRCQALCQSTLESAKSSPVDELTRKERLSAASRIPIASLRGSSNSRVNETPTLGPGRDEKPGSTLAVMKEFRERGAISLPRSTVAILPIDEGAETGQCETDVAVLLARCQRVDHYVPVREKLTLFESLSRMGGRLARSTEDLGRSLSKPSPRGKQRARSLHDLNRAARSVPVREMCRLFEGDRDENSIVPNGSPAGKLGDFSPIPRATKDPPISILKSNANNRTVPACVRTSTRRKHYQK